MGCPAECHQFVDEIYFGKLPIFWGGLFAMDAQHTSGAKLPWKSRSRSLTSELIRELPKMHVHYEYEGSTTVRVGLMGWRNMLNTCWVKNDLEKLGQGHSAQNSSESFPWCTYILNTKLLQPLGPNLSRGEVDPDAHTDTLTDSRTHNPTAICPAALLCGA